MYAKKKRRQDTWWIMAYETVQCRNYNDLVNCKSCLSCSAAMQSKSRVESPDFLEKLESAQVSVPQNTPGQKRALQVSPDRENKRRCLEKTMELNSTETRKDEEMRQCGVILEKLMKDKYGWFFNMPVDSVALGIHDYHKIVERPIDLGTVKLKLDMGGYENSLDFAKDVGLTFYNAMFCYQIGDDVHTMATILLDMFEKQFEKFEVERRTLIVEQQKFSKPLAEFMQSQAVSSQRDTEKHLQMHPQEFVKETILAMRNYNMTTPAGDGEIEIDVQAVDNETMWDLHRFVTLKLKAERNKENPRLRREMSDWERYQLGLVMHECACEYIEEILQIVDKRNANITTPDGDGKIELDIQALDSEIMWDFHRSVMLTLKAEQNKENPQMRREMSFGERYQLAMIVQEFVDDYMDEILQIVNKRNANITTPDGDGKINLDIHALDSETLWDLHRFVDCDSFFRD
ncbi:hypothetical protein POM88_005897 [Heracleum sosnowskyi]|uniref:Bromodomain protein n=1 Tax=Heracleum sosnowskyi TaxID=360622 RepID=A0AAD8N4A5_9APIA|nr:hypothetical protein POM88_005897 [Heracleum sosnowskyi]